MPITPQARATASARGRTARASSARAVAPEAKTEARSRLRETVVEGGFGPRELVVRVNPVDTADGKADLETAAALRLDAVVLPKVEHEDEIKRADEALRAAGAPDSLALWFMVETHRLPL